jgi:hypothetical protein
MKTKNYLLILSLLIIFLITGACKSTTGDKAEKSDRACSEEVALNTLTQSEIEDGWVLLFDGKTTTGWRGYNQEAFPDSGWVVEEGTLHCIGSGKGEAGGKGGDIIYDKKFKNFELKLEWKISEGGNSGIFYLARELEGKPIWHSAPEMQVLDNDKHRDGLDTTHCAGALYDLIPAPRDIVKPVGEWNKVTVYCEKGLVEHWLNGKKILEFHLWTDDWNKMVARSKFVEFNPDWANVAQEGYIGLQDHGDDVWYRNIKVREL